MTTNFIFILFAVAGCMGFVFATSWLLTNVFDYCCELRRLLRDTRDLLKRLDQWLTPVIKRDQTPALPIRKVATRSKIRPALESSRRPTP